MAPHAEKSQLKRGRHSTGDGEQDSKKPRRSQRISSQSHTTSQPTPQTTPLNNKSHLPSPLTHQDSTTSEIYKEATATPPEGRPSQIHHRTPVASPQLHPLSSPPSDTQAFSQFVYPPQALSNDVEDEEAEGVWGYLVPIDSKLGETLVLRKRPACPAPFPHSDFGKGTKSRGKELDPEKSYGEEEASYEQNKLTMGWPAGGYLIGRHIECDRVLNVSTISNRHCLLFSENRGGDSIAVLEDLSSNGTFVNEAIVGRNKRRELKEGDEITILDEARFIFRYPKSRGSSAFTKEYRILQQLGKGHFATVYLCVEKATGDRYAVKRFEKRPGETERSQNDGLQQEIAVLMAVSHPNVLCLKDTYDEDDAVYLILELAPEGELFNWIVMKQKLTEDETRQVFIQLFQGVKYLHERNIVHRDIKPENILLTDKDLSVKLADFGLAKIIGEESFTTTLCGTPSYVAPEILENSKHRKYTRAVDVWSLGVVLYICLCGFPPFSDELYTPQHPYTLSQQIKMGSFDYPSPYWDSVGDPALDLIDKMLTVDIDKRISIDDCLEHPWITQRTINLADSAESLAGAMNDLDFSKRKFQRERTLLSSINDVKISKVIEFQDENFQVKLYEKNPDGKRVHNNPAKNGVAGNGKKEDVPAANRQAAEFMEMGGKGDQPLFGNDTGSRYAVDETPAQTTKT
ncbi:MAG: CAMK RAD53 kinase [Lasallia pustulata]|uniref:CAMK RAD53 kinase n=1 Tax=Lasallia pustulata TaxID=136370 RepID=A0A5M8Q2Q6_9LECA|nr:MAG: CAMK RAD53 kinase [Lasallia pustulata]